MLDLLSRVYTLIWVSTIPGEVQFLGRFKFRSTRDEGERQAIARDYSETVHRLIESGGWREGPALEEQLSDEWMPQAFFEYWLGQ